MQIRSLLHAGILVTSTQQALLFYRDVLNMRVNDQRPDLGYPGAWLTVGDQEVHLMELPNPDPTTGRPAHGGRDRHTAFAVDNLDHLISNLETAQIPFTLSRSGRRALFCRDPDGNALEFTEQSQDAP